MELDLEDEVIEFSVRDSNRAERPQINYRNGDLTVVVPEGSSIDPEKLLLNKKDWVKEKWSEAQKYREKIPDRDFEDGGKISVLGREKEIVIEKRRGNKLEEEKILLAQHLVDRNSVKDEVEKVLRSYARNVFEMKAERFSSEVEEDFDRIFVRDQDTRWGSCSGRKNLNFNWRLILGPEHVLEYVVVHELVHLEVRNHSIEFWNRVGEVLPDYLLSREWLEKNSAKLVY